jgi:8-oxo-dGTP pyrophosphatase MutT (NUDIX family)
MNSYEQQCECVRQALAYTQPIPNDELLIPRDEAGELRRRMTPPPDVTPREAAALLLFYPQEGELWLPLTVRSSALPQHRGEVSLPGGAIDPEDAGPVAAALRETHEEIGIPPGSIEVWGQLAPIYIPPSNFSLTPVVGFMPVAPVLVPSPHEIAATFNVPLRVLLEPGTVQVEAWDLHGLQTLVPFFALEGYKVWGATALILSELLARMRRVLAEAGS